MGDEEKVYKVSKHCFERYAERIMKKEDNNSIKTFVAQNEEKIKKDISKLITYGELIYTGRQVNKEGRGNIVNVYINKDNWVVLLDADSGTVITLYKIDLGCGEDFNTEYTARMMKKLTEAKDTLAKLQMDNINESNMYREMIRENMDQVSEYRAYIKNLEELNVGYQTIIDNNTVKLSLANREVAEVINAMIGKREF